MPLFVKNYETGRNEYRTIDSIEGKTTVTNKADRCDNKNKTKLQ
jgi:hypothetical protein